MIEVLYKRGFFPVRSKRFDSQVDADDFAARVRSAGCEVTVRPDSKAHGTEAVHPDEGPDDPVRNAQNWNDAAAQEKANDPPMIVLFDGKNIEDMTREELLAVCYATAKELEMWRHSSRRWIRIRRTA